jgi:hypothetical protein
MQIRYGFDIALELAQPSTILTMMDVHSDCRRRIAEETEFELSPAIAADRFVDGRGNIVRRLSAPAGRVSLRLDGVFRSDGRQDEADLAAKLVRPSDLPPEALPFLLPAGIASLIFCPISRGRTSARSGAGGPASRPFAISFTSVSDSAIPRRARPGRRARLWRKASACAATLPISPSPSAAASIFRRATATAILATSASRPIPRRWISTPGSKPSSAIAGLPSTRGTIGPASAVS